MSLNTIYKNRDNGIKLQLSNNGDVINHGLLTRIVLDFNDSVTVDSSINPEFFDMSAATSFTVKLGQSSLAVGVYTVDVIGYDASNPHGVMYGTIFLQIAVD